MEIRGSADSQVRKLEGIVLSIELSENLLDGAGMVDRDAIDVSSDEERDDIVVFRNVGAALSEVSALKGRSGDGYLDVEEENGGRKHRELGDEGRELHFACAGIFCDCRRREEQVLLEYCGLLIFVS